MTALHFDQPEIDVTLEHWPLVQPFAIAERVFDAIDTVRVSVTHQGVVGQGEGAGIFYRDDRPADMPAKLDAVLHLFANGIDRDSLQTLLSPGGLRNAIDCALWDLEAKVSGVPAWVRAGIGEMKPLVTNFGCGADTPEAMARCARGYRQAKAIKLKLTGEPVDADRVRAVREARPDVWLSIDGNEGFSRAALETLMPALVECDVKLIEQPFKASEDHLLDGFQSPIPIAADESVQTADSLERLVRRYQVANLKLDKAGGLTEAMAMAARAQALGLELMVGNMFGTSLGMAPACVVGQLCTICDLDGPLFFLEDRPERASYADGRIAVPASLWGGGGRG
jgi:L-alanine-DL-glutamate epimerase-like enolase superfamily enzyme